MLCVFSLVTLFSFSSRGQKKRKTYIGIEQRDLSDGGMLDFIVSTILWLILLVSLVELWT